MKQKTPATTSTDQREEHCRRSSESQTRTRTYTHTTHTVSHKQEKTHTHKPPQKEHDAASCAPTRNRHRSGPLPRVCYSTVSAVSAPTHFFFLCPSQPPPRAKVPSFLTDQKACSDLVRFPQHHSRSPQSSASTAQEVRSHLKKQNDNTGNSHEGEAVSGGGEEERTKQTNTHGVTSAFCKKKKTKRNKKRETRPS